MALSVDDLMQAKDAVGRLLEQLGLQAYLFEVEPSGELWQVRIECATRDGWQALRLEVDATQLRECAADSAAKNELLQQWRERLAACQRT